MHNETVNIFSHVLGAVAFLVALPACAVLAGPRWRAADAADVLACGAYLAGVAACFVLSAAFHTLMAHSEAVYLAGMKLDVQGVLALMWGATAPLVRYALPCEADEALRRRYGVLLAALAAACSAATFMPRFSGPRLGPWRAALFGAFGVGSFALPIAHAAARAGWAEMSARVGLGWVGATAVLNGVGVVVYGLKVSLVLFCSMDRSASQVREYPCGERKVLMVSWFDTYSFPSAGSRDDSISLGRATNSCTSSSSRQLSRTRVL